MNDIEISLPDEMAKFVESETAAGGYASANEYLCALIREAQKRQAKRKLEALEGLSGEDIRP